MKKIVICFLFVIALAPNALKAQTQLYLQYALDKTLSVACIIDYRLEQDMTLDVTMLQAKDDASWNRLVADFNVEALPQDLSQSLADGNEVVLTHYGMKEHPQMPAVTKGDSVDVDNSCFMGIEYKEKTIWVFHYSNSEQLDYLQNKLGLYAMENCGKGNEIGDLYYCMNQDSETGQNLLESFFNK